MEEIFEGLSKKDGGLRC